MDVESGLTKVKAVPKKLDVFIAKVENIANKNTRIWKKSAKMEQYFAHILLNAFSV